MSVMKIASLARISVLLTGLALLSTTPGRAAESIEGIWQGQSGPADNQATLALEIVRSSTGELEARMFIDQIGIYGQMLGAVQRRSPRVYAVPAADMTLTLAGSALQATGFLREPTAAVTLARVPRALVAPPRPAFPAGPEPRWRIRLGGAIFAPVAVADGVAYVGNIDGVMSAVSIADGKRLWSFAAGRPIFGEALATADALYFVCDNGYLFRLDRASGKEKWRYDLGDARVPRVLPDPYVYDYDYRSPRPLLRDGILFVGSGDGSFHAVSADSGTRVWRVDGSSAIRNTAMAAGSLLIYSNATGLVLAVDQSSGQKRWQFDAKAPATEPALVEGKIIVGARDSMLYALDPGDGHAIWSQYWWGSWVESPAVAAQGLAYIGSGDLDRVSGVDPATGRNVWRTDVGGWVLQRPLLTDRSIYVGVSGARRASPIWLPQASALMALDRGTGQVRWQWSLPDAAGTFLHGFVAAPAGFSGNVLIGGVDGTLYAFTAD